MSFFNAVQLNLLHIHEEAKATLYAILIVQWTTQSNVTGVQIQTSLDGKH